MRSKPIKRKLVPVSKLAWYAADPSEFRRNAGGTLNVAAARAGDKAHRAMGRPTNTLGRLCQAVILGTLIAAAIIWATRAGL